MDTKKLRQKILDLAIHGKLVPQDPNDEPASVLLERIRAEKERLIKEGKIKRSRKTAKTSDTPHYENDVPEGWVTTVLDELATFGGGKTPSMDHKEYWNNGKYLWITSKDMKFAHITDSILKISDIALEEMTTYGKGTLLMVIRSGILRHTLPIAILDVQATVNQDIKTISCYVHEIHKYLYYAIKAQEAHILENYHKDGTTVDSIDLDRFKKLSIHLPPLSEQQRIVEEIERWFALIDTIEQGKVDLQTTIKQAKSKILDLAIHGKLVQQNPNDEPASELLKRINPKAEITCDNEHYPQLPKGWSITSMQEVCGLFDGERQEDRLLTNLDAKFLRGFSDGKVIKAGRYVPANTYMILVDGENSGEVFQTSTEGYQGSTFKQLNINENMNEKFVLHIINLHRKSLRENKVGSAIPHLNKKLFKAIPVPIPPYAEQERIINAINAAYALLTVIEENL